MISISSFCEICQWEGHSEACRAAVVKKRKKKRLIHTLEVIVATVASVHNGEVGVSSTRQPVRCHAVVDRTGPSSLS